MEKTDISTGLFPGKSRKSISLTDRLRSGYHRLWYETAEVLARSRNGAKKSPAGSLPDLTLSQHARIKELSAKYSTSFELNYLPETALLNYAYLDLLNRAFQRLNLRVSRNQRMCDVGSADFAYAAALHTFFHPSELVGVEVDGHRLYRNGRSRIDYARGYIHHLPHTTYLTADYRHYIGPADIITAWYPFLTPKPVIARRAPLSLFNPGALLAQVSNNLIIGGIFIMINHGPFEVEVARGIAENVGLVCTGPIYLSETAWFTGGISGADPLASWLRKP